MQTYAPNRSNVVSFSADVPVDQVASTSNNSMIKDLESNLLQSERMSGYPNPELYNKHCIHNYAFPKGLHAISKTES
jgi:hypothetical protein